MKDKIEIFVNQIDEGKKLKQSVFGILLGSFIGIICAIVCDEIIYILPITILLFIAIIISYIVYKIRTRNLVPAISILPDRVEFAKKNFLLRYGITKILYDQIQMLGTELYKLERYGENKYIRIRLKTGNDFYLM